MAQGPKSEMLTGEVLSGAFSLHVETEPRFGRYWPRVRQRVNPIE